MSNEIIEKLKCIEQMLKEQTTTPLTFDKASKYLGISKSHLYSLTSTRMIRHFKPGGKIVYFLKTDLDEWIMKKPVKTECQINQISDEYMINQRNKIKRQA